MQVSGPNLLAQRVALVQPLVHARLASSTRPTTSPGLEVPDLEICLARITHPTSL